MLVKRSRLLALLAVGLLVVPGIVALEAVHSDRVQRSYRQTCGSCHPRTSLGEPPLERWWSLKPDVPENLTSKPGTVEVGLTVENGFRQGIRDLDAALDLSGLGDAVRFEDADSTFARKIQKSGTGPGERPLLAPAPITGLEMTFEARTTGPHWNLSVQRDGDEVAACGTGPDVPPAIERTCRVSWQGSGSTTSNRTASWQIVVELSPASYQHVDQGGWSVSGNVTHRTPVTVQHRNAESGGVTSLGPGDSQRIAWQVQVRDAASLPDDGSLPFRVTAQFRYDHDGDRTCSGYPDCATASATVGGRVGRNASDLDVGEDTPAGARAPLPSVGPAAVVVGVAVAAMVTLLRRRRDR